MNDFKALQDLWQQTDVKPAVPVQELIRQIKVTRRRWLLKTIGSIALLAATFVFIIWVVMSAHLHWLTTKIGVGLILTAVFMAVMVQSSFLPALFDSSDPAQNNRDWLRKMETYQRRQYFMHTRFISAYYICLSAGFLFYMFEVARGNIFFMIAAYALTFGWIAFSWFYLRTRKFRQQKAKTDAMLQDIRALTDDLE